MNALAVAVQGLGYSAALLAMQGLLVFVAQEVAKQESASGGGIKTRRRYLNITPTVSRPVEEDES